MLAVGFSLELPAVAASLKPLRRLVTDLALAIVLPPVAAVITVFALRPSGETAAAILLLAACPVGDIANAYTLLARGSVARSLSLNALTAMLAPISMVAVFAAYPLFGAEHHFIAAPPAALALRLVVFLLLPVSLGMPFVTARLVLPPGSFPPSPVSPRWPSCFCWPWFWPIRHPDRTISPARSQALRSSSPFPWSSAQRFYGCSAAVPERRPRSSLPSRSQCRNRRPGRRQSLGRCPHAGSDGGLFRLGGGDFPAFCRLAGPPREGPASS